MSSLMRLFITAAIAAAVLSVLSVLSSSWPRLTSRTTPVRPTPSVSAGADRSGRVVLAVRTKDCQIKVQTAKEDIFLEDKISRRLGLTVCEEVETGSVSLSGKYFAYTSVSADLETQLRLYAVEFRRDLLLDNFGSMAVADLRFLPYDRLAVLSGYFGSFGAEWLGQYLKIYKVDEIFAGGSLPAEEALKPGENNSTTLVLPDVGRDYRRLVVEKNSVKILDERKDVLASYEAESFFR